MRKLRKSKYAFFVKKENGNYIVYSSMSGAVIVLHEKKYIELPENVLKQDIFDYKANDFFDLMLKNRIFIEDFYDENLMIRGMYEERIIRSDALEIMLVVTRQCNFRCIYCGQSHANERMNVETYDSILSFIENQINKHGYSSVHVTFFGGEPLIEIKKICSFLERLRDLLSELSTEQRTITYKAGMSTNGYLLTPQVFERLVELQCVFFQISIDGMADAHDKMRPLASGEPTWHRIIENLSYMLSTNKHFSVLLRTNFNVEVAESLIEFYNLIGKKFNDKRVSIYYETIKNHGNEKTPATVCGMEELVLDVDIAQLIRENGLICNNCTARLMPCSYVCYASKPNHYIIDEKNQILKCSFALESSDNIIGTLNKGGSYVIDEYNYYNWVYRDYLISEKCKECKVLPLCFGKRCPKTFIRVDEMRCNTDIINAEIEGLLDSYY